MSPAQTCDDVGMRTISVGPPAWALAWPVLFIAGVLMPVITSPATNSGFLLAIPVLGLAALVYRAGWVSLYGSADGLVIRNYRSTRQVPVSEIRGFDVGPLRRGHAVRTVRVLTPARAIPINAYSLRSPWTIVRPAARLRPIAAELNTWADDVKSWRGQQSPHQQATQPRGADPS
jgi:hypothetical protein